MAKKRGFAGMETTKQREIASKGGKAAHQKGTAHQFTREEARAAGRKGGQAAHSKGTAHKFTPEEARAAGRKGGRSGRNNQSETLPATSSSTLVQETTGEIPKANVNANINGSFAAGVNPSTTPMPAGTSP